MMQDDMTEEYVFRPRRKSNHRSAKYFHTYNLKVRLVLNLETGWKKVRVGGKMHASNTSMVKTKNTLGKENRKDENREMMFSR